jgi:hypothetical protein
MGEKTRVTFQEQGSWREFPDNPYSLTINLETPRKKFILVGTYTETNSPESRRQIAKDIKRKLENYAQEQEAIYISPLGGPNKLLMANSLAPEIARNLSTSRLPAIIEDTEIDRR